MRHADHRPDKRVWGFGGLGFRDSDLGFEIKGLGAGLGIQDIIGINWYQVRDKRGFGRIAIKVGYCLSFASGLGISGIAACRSLSLSCQPGLGLDL